MATHFSETLQRLRKAAGFPTAYRFFHDNGGDKVLGMCYRKYLMMEQGRILPLFKHLRAFIFGMRLVPNCPEARELATAWLRTMAGEDAYEDILRPLLAPAPAVPSLSPMDKAMKATLASRRYYMTPEQMDVIAASAANFRCFLALTNDAGAWKPEALAPQLGLTVPAAKKSLEALAGCGLLKQVKGAYKCPYYNVPIEFPHLNTGFRDSHKAAYEKIRRYHEEMVASGKRVWFRRGFIRADGDALPNMYQVLATGIDSAGGYSVADKSERSGVFAIESSVVKLMDF